MKKAALLAPRQGPRLHGEKDEARPLELQASRLVRGELMQKRACASVAIPPSAPRSNAGPGSGAALARPTHREGCAPRCKGAVRPQHLQSLFFRGLETLQVQFFSKAGRFNHHVKAKAVCQLLAVLHKLNAPTQRVLCQHTAET